jgi:3-oxoadipate enol-lactonase
MTFIEGNGTVHFYRLEGRASNDTQPRAPLVLINALGTDHRVHDPLIDALPAALRERPVLSYDLRGQGLSALGAAPHTVATLRDDLALLLDRLALGPAIVFGLSLGGLVAQLLAASAPERVAALCLCATGLDIGAPELWNERIAVVRARGLRPFADSALERWFSPAFRRQHAALVRGYRTMLEQNSGDGYIAALEALRDADLAPYAARVTAPTLVLAGEADVSTPPARVQRLASALAHARYHSVPTAGHFVPVEQPAAVAELLAGFLREVGIV